MPDIGHSSCGLFPIKLLITFFGKHHDNCALWAAQPKSDCAALFCATVKINHLLDYELVKARKEPLDGLRKEQHFII